MKWKAAVKVTEDGEVIDFLDYTNDQSEEIASWSDKNPPIWHGDSAYSDPISAWWYVEVEYEED